jgi:hypothetical protein
MSGIIRIEKNKNYSVVSNVPANDDKLSWEARGILYYLLTKPDGWECRNQDLINKGPAGGDKIERIIDELQEHGYITRQRYQKEDGTFDWVTTIHEMPVEPEETVKERIAKKRATSLEKNRRRAARRKGLTIGVLPTDGSPTNGEHPHIVITKSVINKKKITIKNQKVELGPIAKKLLSICCLNEDRLTKRQGEYLKEALEILIHKINVTEAQLAQFDLFWRQSWRKGSPPTLLQVPELWGEFEQWQVNPLPPPNGKQTGPNIQTINGRNTLVIN